jgi:CheY-like chemotaxis protein
MALLDPDRGSRTFEAGAIDYLLKPISQERLADAVGRARRLNARETAERVARIHHIAEPAGVTRQRKIVGRAREEYVLVSTDEVYAFQAAGGVVWIITAKNKYLATQYFKPRRKETGHDQAQMSGILDQAVERFQERDEEERETVKTLLVNVRNMYGFLSQVIPYQDSDLEQLYTYVCFLLTKLPLGIGRHNREADTVPVSPRDQRFEHLFRRQANFKRYTLGVQSFGIDLVFAQFVLEAERIQEPDGICLHV